MDVSDWRARIDEVDRKILALLNERAGYVLELAPLKREAAIPIEEPKREAAIRENLSHNNRGPLTDQAIYHVFDVIMGEMKAVQAAEATKVKRHVRREPANTLPASKRSTRADSK
jgi:chorismate mutase